MRRSNSHDRKPGDINFWTSYTDLMSGLILVFVLVLGISGLAQRRLLQEKKEKLQQEREELEKLRKKIEEQRSKLQQAERAVEDVQTNVIDRAQSMLAVREKIADSVQKRVGEQFEVDPEDGTLTFFQGGDGSTSEYKADQRVMFEEGESSLTQYGQDRLREAIPSYLHAIFARPEYRKAVDSVVFEGHTNTNFYGENHTQKAYLYNLELSQNRAYSAMEFVLREDLGPEGVDINIRDKLSASGYSYLHPIMEEGEEDEKKSRRIEVHFELEDEKTLRRLQNMFEEVEQMPSLGIAADQSD